ncbi:DUF421 domain-containing protein [Salinactinospora qingdaonensis]|uniref:DUF421 domain-containing protein n=1 Tax=Salinactinospora qingdaonensis TaxID=702744 RepID=A0ABP7FG76_9ACTN
MFSEIGASWESLALVLITTVGAYLALIGLSRITGLRSFSQMTNFDLAATVAFGSIVATTAVSGSTSLLQGIVGLTVLFVVQSLLARLRKRNGGERVLDNGPLLLMSGATVLGDNLDKVQMTRNDLRSKLRLAGVTRIDHVEAVVLEPTGDVSVLLVGPDDPPLDPELLTGVDDGEIATPTS